MSLSVKSSIKAMSFQLYLYGNKVYNKDHAKIIDYMVVMHQDISRGHWSISIKATDLFVVRKYKHKQLSCQCYSAHI